MNKLDLYAVPDTTDAEEAAFENAETIIDRLDGQTLFESGTVDVESLFNVFGLPDVFDSSLDGRGWDDVDPDERERWADLADVIRRFALDRLDTEKVLDAADQLAA